MIKRDFYLHRMIHHMWNGEIKVITGIRRCGKSVFPSSVEVLGNFRRLHFFLALMSHTT